MEVKSATPSSGISTTRSPPGEEQNPEVASAQAHALHDHDMAVPRAGRLNHQDRSSKVGVLVGDRLIGRRGADLVVGGEEIERIDRRIDPEMEAGGDKQNVPVRLDRCQRGSLEACGDCRQRAIGAAVRERIQRIGRQLSGRVARFIGDRLGRLIGLVMVGRTMMMFSTMMIIGSTLPMMRRIGMIVWLGGQSLPNSLRPRAMPGRSSERRKERQQQSNGYKQRYGTVLSHD
jgi:hypothetical protein